VNEQQSGHSLSFKHRRILDLLGNNAPKPDWDRYSSYMRVIDFIAGMTDLYAADMAAQIRGIHPARGFGGGLRVAKRGCATPRGSTAPGNGEPTRRDRTRRM